MRATDPGGWQEEPELGQLDIRRGKEGITEISGIYKEILPKMQDGFQGRHSDLCTLHGDILRYLLEAQHKLV